MLCSLQWTFFPLWEVTASEIIEEQTLAEKPAELLASDISHVSLKSSFDVVAWAGMNVNWVIESSAILEEQALEEEMQNV